MLSPKLEVLTKDLVENQNFYLTHYEQLIQMELCCINCYFTLTDDVLQTGVIEFMESYCIVLKEQVLELMNATSNKCFIRRV